MKYEKQATHLYSHPNTNAKFMQDKFMMGKFFPKPPKNLKEKIKIMRERTIKKQFWINQDEENLLKSKSKRAGLNESEFLRSLIKGYKIKEQPTEQIRDFIKQISGIANNINQIARTVNSTKYIRNQDLEYIKNTIPKFILEFQKKVYSRE